MDASLCWVCEESDCWKVIWDRCSGGVKTLKDFVIFGGFEVQRVWESSKIQETRINTGLQDTGEML